VKAEEFSRRLADMRRRVEQLLNGGGVGREPLEELLVSLEELRVAEEDLRGQNEELAAAHLQIQEERRRYQQLFHYAPDAYLLTDLAGIVREANWSAARLLNVQPQFMAGKAIVSLVAPEDRARIRAELGRWQSEPTP
jgi:PAS domain-containing protein